MKDWQKHRNYQKHKNPDGTYAYIITVDGIDVEVTEKVYTAYSKADRRERYCTERDAGRLLSLECISEKEILQSYFAKQLTESVEDAVIQKLYIKQFWKAYEKLTIEEQYIVRSIAINGMTEQELADELKVSQVAVHKRKHRIVEKILKYF